MNRYTYRAQWLPDYNEYLGVCVELPYMRREGPTAPQAVAAIEEAVKEHVEGLRATGEQVPTPLSERRYSGRFLVRTSPQLHARLVLEAIEQGVPMNQWIVQKLSGRTPSRTFGLSGWD
ncbi:type II toxin-antitoxin system HicB family antitoxin [Mycobacterium sp. E2238]|uniref:type II toxin-antitoxin system HicB family antitoxin n=1 Tax=Mycobacterium sp. E2238 TaxID=1834131 RepID=UPI0007FFADC9|nr:type II toxin-antitoxin system HicB family antitoxin [Mycobacterium sp. E2238]OBI24582.1 pilus assembly protein HicB [Mycobacterium sp. E2238]